MRVFVCVHACTFSHVCGAVPFLISRVPWGLNTGCHPYLLSHITGPVLVSFLEVSCIGNLNPYGLVMCCKSK